MNYGFDLDGITGLDFLQKIKAIINLDKLTIGLEGRTVYADRNLHI